MFVCENILLLLIIEQIQKIKRLIQVHSYQGILNSLPRHENISAVSYNLL